MNDSDSNITLSRRELLKKLGAAGALLGARAIVPAGWSQPRSESGNLPAHAQTSNLATLVVEVTDGPYEFKPSAPAIPPGIFHATVTNGSTIAQGDTAFISQTNGYDLHRVTFSNLTPHTGLTCTVHENSCGRPDQQQPFNLPPGITTLTFAYQPDFVRPAKTTC